MEKLENRLPRQRRLSDFFNYASSNSDVTEQDEKLIEGDSELNENEKFQYFTALATPIITSRNQLQDSLIIQKWELSDVNALEIEIYSCQELQNKQALIIDPRALSQSSLKIQGSLKFISSSMLLDSLAKSALLHSQHLSKYREESVSSELNLDKMRKLLEKEAEALSRDSPRIENMLDQLTLDEGGILFQTSQEKLVNNTSGKRKRDSKLIRKLYYQDNCSQTIIKR